MPVLLADANTPTLGNSDEFNFVSTSAATPHTRYHQVLCFLCEGKSGVCALRVLVAFGDVATTGNAQLVCSKMSPGCDWSLRLQHNSCSTSDWTTVHGGMATFPLEKPTFSLILLSPSVLVQHYFYESK